MAAPPPSRLFLDANVIVSGLQFAGPPHQLLVAASQGQCEAVTCAYAVAEARRVLLQKMGLAGEEAEAALRTMVVTVLPDAGEARAELVKRLLGDARDAPILAAALAAKVEALVTGDAHFFTPAVQARVRVLTPREALGLIVGREAGSEAQPE